LGTPICGSMITLYAVGILAHEIGNTYHLGDPDHGERLATHQPVG